MIIATRLVCLICIFSFLRWLPNNSFIADMFSYKLIFLFVIIISLSTFYLIYCFICCFYKVSMLVCTMYICQIYRKKEKVPLSCLQRVFGKFLLNKTHMLYLNVSIKTTYFTLVSSSVSRYFTLVSYFFHCSQSLLLCQRKLCQYPAISSMKNLYYIDF